MHIGHALFVTLVSFGARFALADDGSTVWLNLAQGVTLKANGSADVVGPARAAIMSPSNQYNTVPFELEISALEQTASVCVFL